MDSISSLIASWYNGAYEGRNVKQGRKEVYDFIIKAYENFQDEVTVLTGRGKHINSNGQKGVLYAAFKKEWMKEKDLSPIIKMFFPIEGNGGYKVVLVKPKKLEVLSENFIESLPLIKKLIADMVQKRQTRLLIQPQFSVRNLSSEEFS